MRSFVLHNLKVLVSPAYVGVMIGYLSFAWFLSNPSVDPTAIYSSEKLTSNYDLLLMSIMTLNYLLFIIQHFKTEWSMPRRDILASRWTPRRVFWGMVASYLLFFFLLFILPTYGTALTQQLVYAPRNVRWWVFLMKVLSGVFGYTLFWTVAAIWCISWLRNEFLALITLGLAYAGSQFLNLVSQGTWFSQHWLFNVSRSDDPSGYWAVGFAWLAFMALSFLVGRRQEKTLLQVEFNEPYRKGMLSRLAEWSGADLAMHHYRMMGLGSQKILMLFTVAGLFLLIPLFRRTDANLMPLAKVYLGAFVPVLFSFNQYFLIKIDREAGIVHNNFLRKIPYSRIILNRWLLLLAPQLAVQLVFVVIVAIVAQPLPVSFILYVLLLNVLCSVANLYFAVTTMTNAVANLFLLFLVYLQLRDDVQHLLESNILSRQLNILSVLVRSDFGPVMAIHWFVVGALIVISLLLTFQRLRRLSFATLDM